MTLDALGMCTDTGEVVEVGPDMSYQRFSIYTDELYPAALADLQTADAAGYAPDSAFGLAQWPLSDADVQLASTPRDELDDADDITRRAGILERARHHFTNRLIEQNGPGIGLKILSQATDGESAWRL